jgi:hypothetical protein
VYKNHITCEEVGKNVDTVGGGLTTMAPVGWEEAEGSGGKLTGEEWLLCILWFLECSIGKRSYQAFSRPCLPRETIPHPFLHTQTFFLLLVMNLASDVLSLHSATEIPQPLPH